MLFLQISPPGPPPPPPPGLPIDDKLICLVLIAIIYGVLVLRKKITTS